MNPVRLRAIEELKRMVLDALDGHEAEVWLFGSCARDEVMQHSDIDIGILPRDTLPSNFFAQLAADIDDSGVIYDVDIVDLGHADAALLDEVRREGIRWRA